MRRTDWKARTLFATRIFCPAQSSPAAAAERVDVAMGEAALDEEVATEVLHHVGRGSRAGTCSCHWPSRPPKQATTHPTVNVGDQDQAVEVDTEALCRKLTASGADRVTGGCRQGGRTELGRLFLFGCRFDSPAAAIFLRTPGPLPGTAPLLHLMDDLCWTAGRTPSPRSRRARWIRSGVDSQPRIFGGLGEPKLKGNRAG